MRAAISPRIFGRVEELKPTYGYLRGDDGRQYFFIPSYVQSPNDFLDLQVDQRCCFLVLAHPRGLRATGITLAEDGSVGEAARAEAHT